MQRKGNLYLGIWSILRLDQVQRSSPSLNLHQ